jgi:hypothetical protein
LPGFWSYTCHLIRFRISNTRTITIPESEMAKRYSAVVSNLFSLTRFFVRIERKEKTQENVSIRAMNEVNSSITLEAALLVICNEVITNRQKPSRLAEVGRICWEVLLAIQNVKLGQGISGKSYRLVILSAPEELPVYRKFRFKTKRWLRRSLLFDDLGDSYGVYVFESFSMFYKQGTLTESIVLNLFYFSINNEHSAVPAVVRRVRRAPIVA